MLGIWLANPTEQQQRKKALLVLREVGGTYFPFWLQTNLWVDFFLKSIVVKYGRFSLSRPLVPICDQNIRYGEAKVTEELQKK